MIKDMPKFIKISEKFNECGKCQTKMERIYSSETFPFEVDCDQIDITVRRCGCFLDH